MSKNNKPILCLDVDGVLCPFGGIPPEGFTRVPTGDGDHLWVAAKTMGDRIRRLMESFHVAWATSQEHQANRAVASLHGLPPFPVIEVHSQEIPISELLAKDSTWRHDWKLPWIEKYVGDRPFAWVDDIISPEGVFWARRRGNAVFVRTDSSVGLTDEHVAELEQFAQTIGGTNGATNQNGGRD